MTTVTARGIGTPAYALDIAVAAPPWLRTPETPVCRVADDLFFPPDYGLRYHKEITAAKALCAACPVRALCLDWAVPQPSLDGIWAGTTPPERRRLRNRTVSRRRAGTHV